MFGTYDIFIGSCDEPREVEEIPMCDVCGCDADDGFVMADELRCRGCVEALVSTDRLATLIAKLEGFNDPDGDLEGARDMLRCIRDDDMTDSDWDDRANWYEVIVLWGLDSEADHDNR